MVEVILPALMFETYFFNLGSVACAVALAAAVFAPPLVLFL